MMRPIVSVVTATLNASPLLALTIDSIREQPRDLIEYIVIDGASSDDTLELVKANEDIVDYWLSETDTGIYDAWNKGLFRSTGQWIIFLGAGDVLGEDWIRSVLAHGDDFDLLYGDLELRISIHGTERRMLTRSRNWAIARALLPTMMSIPHPGLAHRRRLFENTNFDTTYRIVGDWDFLARIAPRNVEYLEGIIQASVVLGGISNMPGSVERQYGEVLRSVRARNFSLPFKLRMRWLLKRLCAEVPALYSEIQALYWQFRAWRARNSPGSVVRHTERPSKINRSK